MKIKDNAQENAEIQETTKYKTDEMILNQFFSFSYGQYFFQLQGLL